MFWVELRECRTAELTNNVTGVEMKAEQEIPNVALQSWGMRQNVETLAEHRYQCVKLLSWEEMWQSVEMRAKQNISIVALMSWIIWLYWQHQPKSQTVKHILSNPDYWNKFGGTIIWNTPDWRNKYIVYSRSLFCGWHSDLHVVMNLYWKKK